jgi:hypothetical protein
MVSTFGGGPAPPRFQLRCHQTKNAAESKIAAPAT